jgi:release factor glutamine methyltransferase
VPDTWAQLAADLPRHEVERLLMAATGRPRRELAGMGSIADTELDRFRTLVARRRRGEPLQYLEGSVQFGPVTLRCDPRALIPRPETEELYEYVTGLLAGTEPQVIVDLATGSGNLALALKHDHPGARVVGCDSDAAALELAAENGRLTGLDVEWRQGDLFAALPAGLRGRVDAVVSNPPYVAEVGADTLPSEVIDHEPHSALFAGPDGLAVLRRIAAGAEEWLRPGGLIGCEIGAEQGPAVAGLFARYRAEVGRDLRGRDRWVVGRRR